jgi:hypothetical protein
VSESTRIAFISAAAAFFGAIAGAGGTYLATDRSEARQDEREERRLEQEAAGAARHLIMEFREAGLMALKVSTLDPARRDLVESGGVTLPLDVTAADRRLLYSRLRWKEYLDVAEAISATQLFVAQLQRQVQKNAVRISREEARSWNDTFGRAIHSLRRVARGD